MLLIIDWSWEFELFRRLRKIKSTCSSTSWIIWSRLFANFKSIAKNSSSWIFAFSDEARSCVINSNILRTLLNRNLSIAHSTSQMREFSIDRILRSQVNRTKKREKLKNRSTMLEMTRRIIIKRKTKYWWLVRLKASNW